MGETTVARGRSDRRPTVVHELVAGAVGGLALGAVLHGIGIVEAVPAIYGAEGLLLGWLTLVGLGAIGGLAFAWIVRSPEFEAFRSRPLHSAAIGVGFAIVLWTFGVVIALPLWLGLLGLDYWVPMLRVDLLAGLVAFGFLTGLLTPLLDRARSASA